MPRRSPHNCKLMTATLAVLAIMPVIGGAEISATDKKAQSTSSVQAYPSRPVAGIVMSNPSSGPDILARLLSPRFAEAFGQQLVIDNRAGASGIIGAEI